METGLEYFTFYKNWYILAQGRDTDEKRLAFYDTIFAYAFDGIIPDTPKRGVSSGKDWAAWDAYSATYPQINKTIARSNAGKLGGINGKGVSKIRREKQTASKTQANEKQTASKVASKTQGINNNININSNTNINNNRDIPPSSPSQELISFALDQRKNTDIEAMFDFFWKAYPGPRKTNRKKCREKFFLIMRKSKDIVSLFNKMMDGIERWKKCSTWIDNGGAFIKAPEVWLNNENWNDFPEPARPRTGGSQPTNIHHDSTVEVENVF